MEIKERIRLAADRLRPAGIFIKQSIGEWIEDKALRHAAALAYYSIFSIAPLLVIAIAVAGFFFGEQAVEGQIVGQLQDFIGADAAVFVENMLREVRETGRSLGATIVSLVTMLFGALVIFSALQDVLNMIWGVHPAPEMGIKYLLRRRLLAFLMVLFFGIAVIGALVGSAALTVAETFSQEWFGTDLEVWALADQLVWLVFFTVVFGAIYKLLPDVRMAWRDVWVGAFMTGLLFAVGIYAISTYIAYSSVGTVFGAAGTLVVLLVWIYYSWVIVLMGAEMTQVWTRRFGYGIKPGKNAVMRVDTTRAVEGRVVAEGVQSARERVDTEEGDNADQPTTDDEQSKGSD